MTKLYLVSYDPVVVIPGVGRHINPVVNNVMLGIGAQHTNLPHQQWLWATLDEAKQCAERLCAENKITYIVAEVTEVGRFAPIKPQWSGVPV